MSTNTATNNGGNLWAVRAESCAATHTLFSSSLGNTGYCTAIASCQTFSEEGICVTCMTGFYLDGMSMCQSCSKVAGCAVCTAPDQCQTCSPGFYMAVTSKDNDKPASECVACDSGCICDNAENTCKGCISTAFYLKETTPKNVCESCSILFPKSLTCD
jgi:hypothetical protein